MFLLMCFAAVWAVVQLALLSALSRSVRFVSLLQAIAFGAYGCGVLAVLVQLGWTRPYSDLTDTPLRSVISFASYTIDPGIEEVVKLLPLAVAAWLVQRFRHQLGYTDWLLFGAGIGAGFGLFEAVMRYSAVDGPATEHRLGTVVSASLSGKAVVPSVETTLVSWLPEPAAWLPFLDVHESLGVNKHLAWSSIAAVGLCYLFRGAARTRLLGLLPLVWATVDHMYNNAKVSDKSLPGLLRPIDGILGFLGDHRGVWVAIALLAAIVADRVTLTRTSATTSTLNLRREPLSPTQGTETLLHVAGRRLPWSGLVAGRFVLGRRAARYAAAAAPGQPATDALLTDVAAAAQLLGRANSASGWDRAVRQYLSAVKDLVQRQLTRPTTIVWAVLAGISLTYLVVGGFEATRGIQEALAGPVGFWVLLSAAVVAWAVLAWQAGQLVRLMPAYAASPRAEVFGRFLLRIGTAAGALVAGVAILALSVLARSGTDHVARSYHVLHALGALLMATGLVLLIWALVTFPPAGAMALAGGGGTVLAPTLTVEFVTALAGAAALETAGVMLAQAADTGGSGSSRDGARTESPESSEAGGSSDNGGLGQVRQTNNVDPQADLLQERIGGVSRAEFANQAGIEYDVISEEFVAQAKPSNFTVNQAFRNQAKRTFEVAVRSGRRPYFQFDGPPRPGVLEALERYAQRYGVEPVIDLVPLGG